MSYYMSDKLVSNSHEHCPAQKFLRAQDTERKKSNEYEQKKHQQNVHSKTKKNENAPNEKCAQNETKRKERISSENQSSEFRLNAFIKKEIQYLYQWHVGLFHFVWLLFGGP